MDDKAGQLDEQHDPDESIAQFAHSIRNTVVTRATGCEFYGLTTDGTTDISTTEQFSCCLQYVGKEDLETHS